MFRWLIRLALLPFLLLGIVVAAVILMAVVGTPTNPPQPAKVEAEPDPEPELPSFPVPKREEPTVTRAEFQAIRSGMNYFEVRDIVGEPGELISSSRMAGISTRMYQWMNRDGSNMSVMFQQGGVINKAQFGLR